MRPLPLMWLSAIVATTACASSDAAPCVEGEPCGVGGRCVDGACVPTGGDTPGDTALEDSATPDSTPGDAADAQGPDGVSDTAAPADAADVDDPADAADGTAPDADTGADDTTNQDATADTSLADTNELDTVEVVREPCSVEGRYDYCDLACGDYQLPMRQCVDGGWNPCTCLTFERTHIAAGGGGRHAGFTDTGTGGRYACYSVDGALTLAREATPGTWTTQPLGVDGVDCDLTPGEPGSALLAYGAANTEVRGHTFFYRSVTGGVLAPPTAAGNTPNYRGVGPRIARAPSGALHAVSLEELSGGPVLRTQQLDLGTSQNLEDLGSAGFSQAISVCDDGTPLITWAIMESDSWVAYVGARRETSWRSKFIPWEVQYVGAGLALECRGGRAYGLMQDASRRKLAFFTSVTPADPASYLAYEVPTTENVGASNDLHVDGAWLWASWATTAGDVRLSVRPSDLSRDWTTYRVVDEAQLSTGALGGDVELTIGPDGRPALLFFGISGADAGPWVATLP